MDGSGWSVQVIIQQAHCMNPTVHSVSSLYPGLSNFYMLLYMLEISQSISVCTQMYPLQQPARRRESYRAPVCSQTVTIGAEMCCRDRDEQDDHQMAFNNLLVAKDLRAWKAI